MNRWRVIDEGEMVYREANSTPNDEVTDLEFLSEPGTLLSYFAKEPLDWFVAVNAIELLATATNGGRFQVRVVDRQSPCLS